MDEVIRKNLNYLVKKLDFRDVRDLMRQERTLSDETFQEIDNKITREDKARILLDNLMIKGPKAHHTFIEALNSNEHTKYIAQFLEDSLQKEQNSKSDISNTKSPVRDFIERPQVDEKISNSLEQNRIAFITGIPGSGKSQMASAYCKAHGDEGPNSVNWTIQADEKGKAIQSLEVLATRLGLPKGVHTPADLKNLLRDILEHLQGDSRRKTAKHFLIIDNADEETCNLIEDCVRHANARNTNVLVTSCYKVVSGSVHLTGYTEEEVIGFFHKDQFCKEHIKKGDILDFAKESGRLPLAMTAARAYISKAKISIANYQKKLNSENEKVVKALWDNKQISPDYDRSLLGALSLNVQMVKEEFEKDSDVELMMTAFHSLAFFGSEDIPLFLLMNSTDNEQEEEHGVLVDRFVEVIEKLSIGTVVCLPFETHGLDDRVISVHSVSQEAISKTLGKSEDIFLNVIYRIVGFTCDKDNRMARDFDIGLSIIGHLISVSKKIKTGFFESCNEELQFLHLHILDVLGYHFSQDLFSRNESIPYFNEAMDEICQLASIEPKTLSVIGSKAVFEKLCSVDIPTQYLSNFRSFRYIKKDYFEIWNTPLLSNKNEGCLSPDVITRLEGSNVFLKLEDFRKSYLTEVMVSVLYSYARTYFLFKSDDENLNEEQYRMAQLALELSQHISTSFGRHILHSLTSNRSCVLNFKCEKNDHQGNQKGNDQFMKDLDFAVGIYNSFIVDQDVYFMFGVLKFKPEYDPLHKLVCYKKLIRCHHKYYEVCEDRRVSKDIFQKGLTCVELMMRILDENCELNSQNKSEYYVEAASLYLLHRGNEYITEAVDLLKKALDLHTSKPVPQKRRDFGNLKRWFRILEKLVSLFCENPGNSVLEKSVLIEDVQTYISTEVDVEYKVKAKRLIQKLRSL